MLIAKELTDQILSAAIDVHRYFGPGLLESAYEKCLCHELTLRNLAFERQKLLPIIYKGIKVDTGYRLDLVVENKVILELKCVDAILPVHEALIIDLFEAGKDFRWTAAEF